MYIYIFNSYISIADPWNDALLSHQKKSAVQMSTVQNSAVQMIIIQKKCYIIVFLLEKDH